jgi:Flp pilus assembly protein TadB
MDSLKGQRVLKQMTLPTIYSKKSNGILSIFPTVLMDMVFLLNNAELDFIWALWRGKNF